MEEVVHCSECRYLVERPAGVYGNRYYNGVNYKCTLLKNVGFFNCEVDGFCAWGRLREQ